MKTLSMVLALLLTIAGGCAQKDGLTRSPEGTVKVDYNDPIVLGVNQTGIAEGNASITFIEVVNDSRCPVGANCPTEGNAQVALLYQSSSQQPVTFRLNTAARQRRDTAFGPITVTLHELDPKPVAGRTLSPDDYAILITLTRTK